VLGGFGNVPGALLGGLALGLTDQLVATYVSANTATVIPYLLMLVVLMVRPTGFFGARQLVRS
jgi:branched-chain amino acid transport system permease protein